MEGRPPPPDVPIVWCDFNARGLSGGEDDNCYYSLHRDRLRALEPTAGMKVFIYDDDVTDAGEAEVFGYVAVLEPVQGFVSDWRARPEEGTWYRGPAPWPQDPAPS